LPTAANSTAKASSSAEPPCRKRKAEDEADEADDSDEDDDDEDDEDVFDVEVYNEDVFDDDDDGPTIWMEDTVMFN
jgi:hypothetical protein